MKPNKDISAGVSRRSFLKGGAIGATAVVASGLLGCSVGDQKATSAEEEKQAISPENWDYEADIVVLGCGSAGIGAAVEGIRAGNTVLVLEKESEQTYGGSSRINAGFIQPLTPEFVNEQAFGMYPAGRLEPYCAEADAVVQEWLDHGIDAMPLSDGYYVTVGNGPAVFALMEEQLKESDAPVLFETRATDLIQNGQGEVIGVYAEQNGAAVAVKAKKAVVLATGGMIANQEMMETMFYPGVKIINIGAPYQTGDGHVMAFGIGAKPWGSSTFFGLETEGYVAVKASDEIGTGIELNISLPSMFMVNRDGKRVTNESNIQAHQKGGITAFNYLGSYSGGHHGVDGYLNLPMYMIFDQAAFDFASVGNGASSCGWALFGTDGMQYRWSDDNKAELEKGWIETADTIDGLAAKIGVSAENLAATVAEFNACCADGIDEFGRTLTADSAFGEGPFYAIETTMGFIYSIWGPKFDEAGCVLNWSDERIPRLYVAGDCSQGVLQNPCAGIQGSMAAGRLAVRDAVNLPAWDEA